VDGELEDVAAIPRAAAARLGVDHAHAEARPESPPFACDHRVAEPRRDTDERHVRSLARRAREEDAPAEREPFHDRDVDRKTRQILYGDVREAIDRADLDGAPRR